MPRSCTICEHPERKAIDRALVGETSNICRYRRYSTFRNQRCAATRLTIFPPSW